MLLQDKVVLITGASRGIGQATSLLFARHGARLALNYNHSEEAITSLLEQVTNLGAEAIAIKADVGDRTQVEAMFKQVRSQFKRLDVLVNNAGVLQDDLLLMAQDSDYEKMMHVNLKGVFNCMQYGAKLMMRKEQGKIINTSSIIGRRGNSGQLIYAATKAGVIGMTTSGAKELGQFGITVNAVAPGVIDTDMTAQLQPAFKEKLLAGVALGRMGTPEEVAKVILFLASELSDYVSGQVIGVDGCQVI